MKGCTAAVPVEGTEERLAAVSSQSIAALGTDAILRHRLLTKYVLPMLEGTAYGLFVILCGRRHHDRQHARNTTST
jgi:hypothetical protein